MNATKSLFNLTLAVAVPALVAGAMASCSSAVKKQKEKSEEMNNEYVSELRDSAKNLEKHIETSAALLEELNTLTNKMLEEFTRVDNPRQVEGYYILRSMAPNYPLQSTGLAARMTLGEQLELVAAMRGAKFDRISVTSNGKSVDSDAVPHDQALNYYDGSLNTVAFTGAAADSVAKFIADSDNSHVVVTFNEGGKTTGRVTLNPSAINMVTKTWELYAARTRVGELEKEIPLANRKLELLRDRIDDKAAAPQGTASEADK